MSTVVLVGAQWGDEGKGKITDFLAEKADVVVRYAGGANAGHTVVAHGQEYKLHLIPSGILYKDKWCVIANGVVMDPGVVISEIDKLQAAGICMEHLRISGRAHVIMPYHKRLDELEEERRGKNKIGTTKRGIGPAYKDKYARVGIRVADLLDAEEFAGKLAQALERKNEEITKLYGGEGFEFDEILKEYTAYAERLRPYVTDTSVLIYDAIQKGEKVLFEGAQGTLLDIDHGTFPFVTSSHPVAGGACTGAGVGPTAIDKVIGVCKAYTTRVGEGPFPTELTGEVGEQIRQAGHEFGTTTGRPRRCGWFDTVILRYAVRVCGLTNIAITKIDVLDQIPKLKICTGYRYKGEILKEFPDTLKVLAACEPVYEEMDGWMADTTGVREFSDLPVNCQKYLLRLQELSGVEAAILAVGPDREQTIVVKQLFA